MFSFFKSSKKHSPSDSPPNEPIPGPESDGFTIINSPTHPSSPQSNQFQQSSNNSGYPNLYPAYNPTTGQFTGGSSYGSGGYGVGMQQPTMTGGSGGNGVTDSNQEATQQHPHHYLQGVPFKMSAEVDDGDENGKELAKIQVDEILALLTRTMDFQSDYEFRLERSVVT